MTIRNLVVAVVAGLLTLMLAPGAAGETVTLTLEAYLPAALPTVSTVIDIPDPDDQLAVSVEACLFSMSPEGWDLASFGTAYEVKGPPDWSASVCMMAIPGPSDQLTELLGYELNEEALTFGPFYEMWFHTDAWCERLEHNIGESPNNYGVITGSMGGVWGQGTVPNWGRFYIPEPATLALLAGGGLLLIRKRRAD